MSETRITVIMATTLESSRLESLDRALASVLDQSDERVGRVLPLLVVNGDRFDAERLSQWRMRNDIRVEYLERGSLPAALIHGRNCVESEYFAFLDDDDVYLPGTLSARCEVLDTCPDIDVAVSNGILVSSDGEHPSTRRHDLHDVDPLVGLAFENWLLSAGGLFRAATVDASYWNEGDKYLEWTAVAFRLGLRRRVRFLREPGFRIADTPGSLSKSGGFIYTRYRVLDALLAEYGGSLSREVKRVWYRKLGNELHLLADIARQDGHWVQAWWFHLRSLVSPDGLRYLAYTRKLFRRA